MPDQPVYICPETCADFLGEDGCANDLTTKHARYEETGPYPLCPWYREKTYRILNRITEQWWQGQAPSAQEACQKAGWQIGDCWVRERTPVRPNPYRESGYSGGGWKNAKKGGTP